MATQESGPMSTDKRNCSETDGGSNYLRAECVGEQLRLMVNGQLVAQSVTQNVIMGDVGLIAGSYEKSGVNIRFDNFSTVQP